MNATARPTRLFYPHSFRRGIVSVQPVQKRRKLPVFIFFTGLTGLCLYGYWKYITHHNYPPTVADLLKEGLMATINGGGPRKPDYSKAFVKYVEALQEADRLGMDPLSDEYTGIQIIIAESYERLNLLPEAASMYSEVANTYLIALTKGDVPASQRDRIIARDLRVVLMAATLLSTNAESFKSAFELLRLHLVLATKEAASKSEELKAGGKATFDLQMLDDFKTGQLPDTLLESCWGSYKHEIVAIRDLMAGMATARGEYAQALMVKTKTTEMMAVSGFSIGECLLSVANIASLLYLQSVNLKFSSPESKESELGAPQFLDMSEQFYKKIIETIDSLNVRRKDLLHEAYVMSLYGSGVISATKGNWALASEQLNEARLRARGSEMESLMETCKGEISKIDKLKSLTPEELKELPMEELPTIDIMFWKMAPEDRPELSLE